MLHYKKQLGFSILSIILIIVAIIIVIGVWALSGNSNASSNKSSIDIQSSSIINDGLAIKLAFDTLITQGASPTNVRYKPNTIGTLEAPNILDTINGISAPKPNIKSIRSSNLTASDGIWILGSMNINGLGLNGVSDFEQVILLTGVKDSVCQSINQTLHGSAFIPATNFSNSSVFVSNFMNPINANNPNSNVAMQILDMTSITSWMNGCLAAANNLTDHNMYYQVLYIK